MATTDHGECAWCGNPLNGQAPTGLPVSHWWDYLDERQIADDRYCSARCIERRVMELFHRPKRRVPTKNKDAIFALTEDEKWPRFTAEIPPELAELLDRVQRKQLGVNVSAASRAGIVRAGLRLYLEKYAQALEPAIDTTYELDDRKELPA